MLYDTERKRRHAGIIALLHTVFICVRMAHNGYRRYGNSNAKLHHPSLDEAFCPAFFKKRVAEYTGIPIFFYEGAFEEGLLIKFRITAHFLYNLFTITPTRFKYAVVIWIFPKLLRQALKEWNVWILQ